MSNQLNIDKLIDSDKNFYEMTCVAIKEAALISDDQEKIEKLEEEHAKIVSVALNKVLDNEVEYTTSEQR